MTAPATTEDKLLGGRLTLSQPAAGYRVAIDALLLAAATHLATGERALELGAGVGAAGLALAARVPDAAVDMIELQPELAALCRRNIEANGLADRARVFEADVLSLSPEVRDYDAVLFNPPYLKPEDNDAAPDPIKRIATVEGPARLPDWMRAAAGAARTGGRVIAIHRSDRLADLLAAAAEADVGGLEIIPLWPKPHTPASRVILRGRKGKGGRLQLKPGLVLHRPEGGYTDDADAVLQGACPLA